MAVFLIELLVGLEHLIGKENIAITNKELPISLFIFILIIIHLFPLRNQLLNLLISKTITHLNIASYTRRTIKTIQFSFLSSATKPSCAFFSSVFFLCAAKASRTRSQGSLSEGVIAIGS
jgi:hypothetical protein